MTVLIILAVLFAALFIVIPLIEKSKYRMSEQDVGKISRWILPLVAVLLLIQLIRLI